MSVIYSAESFPRVRIPTCRRFAHTLLLLLVVVCAGLLPAREARAMSAIDALETVCSKVAICGDFNAAKQVIDACLGDNKDDLNCLVAIANIASSNEIGTGENYVNAVIQCTKSATSTLTISASCEKQLEAAGVPKDKIEDVKSIIIACNSADTVDGAINCAQGLLDSPLAQDANVNVPSWVDSLFDVYHDIRDKDYLGLVEKVGVTVVCAIAEYLSSVDFCGAIETLVEIGGDVVDVVEDVGGAIVDGLEDLFGTTNEDPSIFYAQVWQPQINATAQATMQSSAQFRAQTGQLYSACYGYFEPTNMSADKSHRVCFDMRDGTNRSDDRFVGIGAFTQNVLRQVALLKLPAAVLKHASKFQTYAADEYASLQPKAGNAPPIKSNHKSVDPTDRFGVQGMYGYSQQTLQALKANPSDWPVGSVGLGAAARISDAASKYKVADTTSGDDGNRVLASADQIIEDALTAAENSGKLTQRIDTAVKNLVAGQAKTKEEGDKIAAVIKAQEQADADKDPGNQALKAAHAACAAAANPKQCNYNVDGGVTACQQKVKAFDNAHPEAFDPDAGGAGSKARAQREQVRISCDQDILKGVLVQNDPAQAVLAKAHMACKTTALPPTCDAQVLQRAVACGPYDPAASAASQNKRETCENAILQGLLASSPTATAPSDLHAICSQGTDPDPKKCNAEVDKRYAACAQKLRDFDQAHPDQSGGNGMSARIQRQALDKSCQKDITQWAQAFVAAQPKVGTMTSQVANTSSSQSKAAVANDANDPSAKLLKEARDVCAATSDPDPKRCSAEINQREAACRKTRTTAGDRQSCSNDILHWAQLFIKPLPGTPSGLRSHCEANTDPDTRKCEAEVDKRWATCAQRLRDFDLAHVGAADNDKSGRVQIARSCDDPIVKWADLFAHPAKSAAAAAPVTRGVTPAANTKHAEPTPSSHTTTSAPVAHTQATTTHAAAPVDTHKAPTPPPIRTPPPHPENAISERGCAADARHPHEFVCADRRALDACNADGKKHQGLNLKCSLRR